MDIGLRLLNTGQQALDAGIPALARTLEAAGADSLWVADHVVQPETIESFYPFAPDGRASWPTDSPWLDALVSLAAAAAVTERVRLGTAVLVLPLREPVVFAKQAATIDALSGGRLELGVGAGWLREEFEALGVPFAGRGSRMEEWMAIARECWTGRPAAHSSERYVLPAGTQAFPAPPHRIPFLVGGHSPIALQRAARAADGWLGHHHADAIDPDHVRSVIGTLRGHGAESPRIVLRVVGALGNCEPVAAALPALSAAGVHEVIVDVPAEDLDAARADVELLRSAVA